MESYGKRYFFLLILTVERALTKCYFSVGMTSYLPVLMTKSLSYISSFWTALYFYILAYSAYYYCCYSYWTFSYRYLNSATISPGVAVSPFNHGCWAISSIVGLWLASSATMLTNNCLNYSFLNSSQSGTLFKWWFQKKSNF